MSGTITSIRRPTSSTCMSRDSDRKSTRASTVRSSTPFAAPGTWFATASGRGLEASTMTALGKLLRSTAFRLLLAYLFVFTVFAFFTIGYVAWNARRVLDDQIVSTIEAEIAGLSEQYRTGGIRRLVNIVERRASEPGASLYLVTTNAGE